MAFSFRIIFRYTYIRMEPHLKYGAANQKGEEKTDGRTTTFKAPDGVNVYDPAFDVDAGEK